MPKLTLSESAATDAGIAADAARTLILITPSGGGCRWCFGATYSATHDQPLEPNQPLIIQAPYAAEAVSFSVARGCVLNVTLKP